jgi:hypothetical protein
LEEQLSSRAFVRTPNIYLLTYDSYVHNETMLRYGIDNSEQESHLNDHGFTIYEETTSTGWHSLLSMSALLGLEPSFEDPTRVTSGDSFVVRTLEANGYATYFVGIPYLLGRHDLNYDGVTLQRRGNGTAILIKAVAVGRFRFNLEFETSSAEQMLRAKRRIIRGEAPSPRFLYNHTGPGHSQNSGECVDDEVDRFQERLHEANIEMRGDVEAIEESDPGAIVIIHGDHGPSLLGDCHWLDDYPEEEITRPLLQDRWGAFLAIRWPKETEQQQYELELIQDVFPAVLSYVYEDSTLMEHVLPRVSTRAYSDAVLIEDGWIMKGPDRGERLFLGSPQTPSSRPD